MGYVFDALKRSWSHDGKPNTPPSAGGAPAPTPAPPPAKSSESQMTPGSEEQADGGAFSQGDIVSPSDLGLDSDQALESAESAADAVADASYEATTAATDFINAALTASTPQARRPAPAAHKLSPTPKAAATEPTMPVERPSETKRSAPPAATPAPASAASPTPTAEELAAWNGIEHVPAAREIDDRVVLLVSPASAIAEEYRAIRTALMARWQQKRHLVHTITSAVPREGKTLTALNLGLSFAELRNRKTLVIEGDLRTPSMSSLLSLPDTPGLVGVLTGVCEPGDAVIRVGGNKLCVLPAGIATSDSAVQLLSSSELAELIQRVRTIFDHVIIDTPAVLELADAGILGALSDEVILVSRMHRTSRTIIDQAMQSLSSYNAPVGAMVATNERPRSRSLIGTRGPRRRYSA